MIDWVYNSLIVVVVLVWVGSIVLSRRSIRQPSKLALNVVTAVLWIVFALAAAALILNFSYLERSHDGDNAVDGAVRNFIEGANVYAEPVVPRFKEMGHFSLFGDQGDGIPVWTNGTYNYPPLHLLTYTGAYYATGWTGFPYWFVLTNLVFAVLSLVLIRKLLPIKWQYFVPVAGLALVWLAYSNSSLTVFLICLAIFVRSAKYAHWEAFSLMILGLATLTKTFAAIPLIVLLLYDLQQELSKRDWRKIAEISASLVSVALIALVLILPFGFSEVMDSTVFIYSSGSNPDEMPTGGTLLSETLHDSSLYAWISIAFVLAAIMAGLYFRNANDRILLVSVVFLFVLDKSTLAPFTMVMIFLALRVYESFEGADLGRDSESASRDLNESGAIDSKPT